MRTGRSPRSRTGRQMPPGFHVSSRQSQCWKTPVRLRLAVLSRCGEHVTSTASVCSVRAGEQLGDLEGVRGEVALGVADVGAVEPDVALVEEPVEGEPEPPVGPGRGCSKCVEARRRCSSGPSPCPAERRASSKRQWRRGRVDRRPQLADPSKVRRLDVVRRGAARRRRSDARDATCQLPRLGPCLCGWACSRPPRSTPPRSGAEGASARRPA